jgi:hypothetical protein
VSQVLNPGGAAPAFDAAPAVPPGGYGAGYAGGYAATPGGVPMAQFQDPPNLNWGLVLLFDFLTCGIFQIVWNLILSAWMKRVQPNSQAILYYAVGYGLGLANSAFSVPIFIATMHHVKPHPHLGLTLISIIAWAIRIPARFNMKSSIEEHYNTVEPLGIRLNGFAVFFFGGLYIQSKLNRINEMKQVLRYREFGR